MLQRNRDGRKSSFNYDPNLNRRASKARKARNGTRSGKDKLDSLRRGAPHGTGTQRQRLGAVKQFFETNAADALNELKAHNNRIRKHLADKRWTSNEAAFEEIASAAIELGVRGAHELGDDDAHFDPKLLADLSMATADNVAKRYSIREKIAHKGSYFDRIVQEIWDANEMIKNLDGTLTMH